MTDEELDKLVQEKMISGMSQAPSVSPEMTDEELDKIVFEKMSQDPERELSSLNPIEVDGENEADLGFINRAKYSIEPLESNRRQLLINEFGPENVSQDKEGNLYLRQNGKVRPVNKEGLSVADGADFLGAMPEMLGAGAGALVGMGPASIPFAVAGGAAGSAVRQGISKLIDNPQVATPIERASEIAMSAGFSGVGAGAGKIIKVGAKKSIPILKRAFSNFNISNEGAKMAKIAMREGIPEPTSGQLSGGYDQVMEDILKERPLFGKKLRKNLDNQVNAIKKNLTKEFGDFVDEETGRELAGTNIKEIASGSIKAIKKQSSELFDKVSEEGKEVLIDGGQFYRELNENFTKLGLFDINGSPVSHSSRTGLTQDQFKRVQGVFGDILQDVRKSVSAHGSDDLLGASSTLGQLDATTINTMRKFIDSNIKEGANQGLDNVLLIKLRESFLDISEGMIGKKSKSLKRDFRLARALWGKQLRMKELYKKGGAKGIGIEDLSDERVIEKIFKTRKNVKILKELVGDEAAEKAGTSYVNDLLIKRLGGEDQISAQGALNIIKKNGEAVKEAIGSKKYKSLTDNLFFLKKIGRPINPSKTGIINIMSDGWGLKNIATGTLQTGVKKARESGLKSSKKLLEVSQKLPKISGKGANLLTDTTQREGAFFTKGPKSISDNKTSDNSRKTASLKGRKKWADDGAKKLYKLINRKNVDRLRGSKKGLDLLVRASDLKTDSKSMERLIEKIEKQLKDKTI